MSWRHLAAASLATLGTADPRRRLAAAHLRPHLAYTHRERIAARQRAIQPISTRDPECRPHAVTRFDARSRDPTLQGLDGAQRAQQFGIHKRRRLGCSCGWPEAQHAPGVVHAHGLRAGRGGCDRSRWLRERQSAGNRKSETAPKKVRQQRRLRRKRKRSEKQAGAGLYGEGAQPHARRSIATIESVRVMSACIPKIQAASAEGYLSYREL